MVNKILVLLIRLFLKYNELRFHSLTSCLGGFSLTFLVRRKGSDYHSITVNMTNEKLELVRNWSAQAYKDILNKKQKRV